MTRFSQGGAQRVDGPEESQRLASWYTPGLSDAIGDRLLMFDNSTSSSLELLRFRPEFSKADGFEDALRRRVEELANFTHPSIAKVRAVESLGEEDGLALISNHTVGRRLSEILQDAHGPQFATELVSQLVPVLAALQEQGQGMAHGLLTPERVIVTPDGRLVLSEHVLAAAIDALGLPPEKLRDDLGLMVPAGTSSLGRSARRHRPTGLSGAVAARRSPRPIARRGPRDRGPAETPVAWPGPGNTALSAALARARAPGGRSVVRVGKRRRTCADGMARSWTVRGPPQ